MPNLYILLFLSVHVFLSKCSQEGQETSTPCESVEFNTAFEATPMQSYCLSDGQQIRVDSLVNALCPCNARCVWGGEILAYVTIGTDKAKPYTIRGAEENNSVGALQFKIEEYTFVEDCSSSNASPEVASIDLRITKKEEWESNQR